MREELRMVPERTLTKRKAIAEWLKGHDDIAIITQAEDGNTLGSALALMHALHNMGKRAFVCNRDEMPGYLRMLPGWESIVTPDDIPFPPKAVIAIDCADEARMGTAIGLIKEGMDVAVIDHHETNRMAFAPSWVEGEEAATGVLIQTLLGEMGAEMTSEIALCLYAAISTDTGNFSFSNTTPEALCAAAECLRAGFDLADLSFRLFRMKSQGRTRLLGRALNSIEYLEDGQIALIRLKRSEFAELGATDADTEGVVNFGIDTEGVEVAILAVERAGSTKFSLRSRNRVNVAQAAAALGGGGHSRAAGVTLQLPMEEAVEQVLNALVRAVREP